MRFVSIVAGISLLASQVAFAAGPQPQFPQGGAVPQPPPSVQIVTPGGVADAVTAARKVETASAWGLTISRAALRPSYWITPMQPRRPAGGSLFIANEFPTTPIYTSTAAMPYGSIRMSRTTNAAWWVGLNDLPTSQNDWLLIECIVSDVNTARLSIDFATTPRALQTTRTAPVTERISHSHLTVKNNRVAALFPPSTGSTRSVGVGGQGPSPGHWYFGGCEVTPIRL